MNDHSALIVALQNADLYDHAIEKFELIETHISWVLLTGPYAYKIKKPVNLGFLDFSSLDRRRHFCLEELRLNRRLAPQLYLDVVAITGTESAPRLNGSGEPLEYAVKMRQFPQEAQLDHVLEQGELQDIHVDQLAETVAHFHAAIPVADRSSAFGTPEKVYRPVMDNFSHMRPFVTEPGDREKLGHIEEWSKTNYTRHLLDFQDRKNGGSIRECHGDMHLANMVLLDNRVTLFDCIEFNEALRWIDVMSEIAFVTMDLDDRGQQAFGARFLNGYLQHTGDYDGLRVLRYYQVYRALVRAKVACIRLQQADISTADRLHNETLFRGYLELAERYMRPPASAFIITHGFSGSGKTLLSQPLLEHLGAIRLRSDVERKRLAGMAATRRATANVGTGLYSPASSKHTYDALSDLAMRVIEAGYPVIVDATFLKRDQRDQFRRVATILNVPFVILDFHAPKEQLKQWIRERAERNTDASDAGVEVLEHQMATHQALAGDEQARVIRVDTAHEVDINALTAEVQARIARC